MSQAARYLVCATPGSGSEILRAALARNGSIGIPAEHHRPADLGDPAWPVCIWVSRSDKLAQARSLLLDGASGDEQALARELEQADAAWADYFTEARIRPVGVVYEDDLGRDPDAAARRVLRQLGISPVRAAAPVSTAPLAAGPAA